jgi:hypothetical protein
MDWRVIHMEELECHIVNLEDNPSDEMRRNETLKVTVDNLKRGNMKLTMELYDMDYKVCLREIRRSHTNMDDKVCLREILRHCTLEEAMLPKKTH